MRGERRGRELGRELVTLQAGGGFSFFRIPASDFSLCLSTDHFYFIFCRAVVIEGRFVVCFFVLQKM